MNAPIPTKDDVIKMLVDLRKTFAHALTQPHITAARFNDIREQMLPLDQQLRAMGVDLEPTPQMAATYVKPTRHQRRARNRISKHKSYESRLLQRMIRNAADDETDGPV